MLGLTENLSEKMRTIGDGNTRYQQVDEEHDMETALTLEEIELETTEFLPDRLVMGSLCQPKCGDGCDTVSVSVRVDVCISLGCK